MKRSSLTAFSILLIFSLVSTSCLKTKPPVQTVKRVGLVSGIGGFSDSGFNQSILNGFQKAAKDFPLYCQARECKTADDVKANIDYYLANGFELIITTGYAEAQATIDVANSHLGTGFVILDYSIPTPPSNILCAVFDVDQSSFTSGFLAAWWAYKKDQLNPIAGFVAGPDIEGIRQFSVSYTNGVSYFNNLYKQNVKTLGYFADSFSDTLQGAHLADSLLKQNVNTIFVFAGKTGNGALYKVKEAFKWAIGVDVDQYHSIPAVGPVLLTSCVKYLDVVTYDILKSFYYGGLQGGLTVHGNLSNGGVGLASFHNYDILIPDSIKTEISIIENGIKNGTIKTGWPQ